MGIIGSIRKHSIWAVVAVGIAILAFIIGDIAGNQKGPGDLGRVNGEAMTQQRFNDLVAEAEGDLCIVSYNHGLGLCMIMQTLDKPGELGTFVFVLFDIDSRKVISHWTLSGTPAGFGVRNYWAHSVYEALEKVKTYKE